MEKILLAVDAINMEESALVFASYLAGLTKSTITGVFLENLENEERPVLKHMNGLAYMDWEVDEASENHQSKIALIEKNISLFKAGCVSRKITCDLHRDRGVPLYELINESRFADVLVIDADTSFKKRYDGTPSEFVKDILSKAECPVIVAPERFEGVDEIVFTYHGTSSSMFAIKQFTYLFPELKDRKISVIQVNKEGEWHDADKCKLKEWLKVHYSDISFEALKGETDSTLFDCLLKRKKIFLVMGAYGRNALLQFFRKSHADILIQNIMKPIFIAHL